ncbi:MAG TPA: methyltransferase domain-containing protein [Ilumatobacteraceae bacterium]|nr:methyltransferase domain-containing protein [Ilumatobacteraceae bacterium]
MTTDRSGDDDRGAPGWRGVDEGWGRRAVDFATLSEPSNCREYVALHQHLGIGPGDRVLDVACGAGLAIELARARGATCAGIDASPRLIEVARDRNPEADLHVGDMHAMPWDDASFDVVTSFRGIWGTTPDAVAEVHRVLAPGGRVGITVWGHIKVSPGAWALAPFTLASPPKVANQAAMVALGRPGAGEELLAKSGFVDVARFDIPFVWEFADPDEYARALASLGPAYEAIQTVGEEAFIRSATDAANERVREGLPLRAAIAVVGYVARKPKSTATVASGGAASAEPSTEASFLAAPEVSADVQRLFDDDVDELGYVMNASRLWAHQPTTQLGLFDLLGQVARAGSLTFRQRGILVTACASALGDAYCSLAWGKKLAGEAGDDVAGSVLRGDDQVLDAAERALAGWARQITRDPNGTGASDVQALRDAGYDDAQIFAITAFVALRIAFSTVNDALGARPDRILGETVPASVRDAVTFGRPVDAGE